MNFISGYGRLGSMCPTIGICRTFIPLGVAKRFRLGIHW